MSLDDNVWKGLDDDDFLSINCDELSASKTREKFVDFGQPFSDSYPENPARTVASPPQTPTKSGQNGAFKGTPKKRKGLGANGTVALPVRSTSPATSITKFVRKKRPTDDIPLHHYRYGRLWVTHIVQQYWCEQQMVYNFDPPVELRDAVLVTPPQVTTGATLHLARELQVHDIVRVKVTSSEDRFALKLINLLDAVRSVLQLGNAVAREIPVFGTPFNLDVFVIGTIDEIRCPPGTLDFEICEFKTRMTASLPPDAQRMTHDLQVMLYKQMFDSLVHGKLSKETVAKHMNLNLKKFLGSDIVSQSGDERMNNLSNLFDKVFETMKALPFIATLSVEYVFQEDSSLIGVVPVLYDENWLKEKLVDAMAYWKGERPPRGVDIEECWKCISCCYNDVCPWKEKFSKLRPGPELAITSNHATLNKDDPVAESENRASVNIDSICISEIVELERIVDGLTDQNNT